MTADERAPHDRLAAAHTSIQALRREIGRVVIGQSGLIDRILIAILVRGHLLLEGVPGLAKTLVVKTLAAAMEGSFRRIQFTPDLLPADVTGTLIFDPSNGTFNARLGPIFANLVLADEINRAPAKVQSALLEAMQERQVTLGDATHPLPDPFVVMATQNPIEHEGTYALPEAQVDRFLMKVHVDYPTKDEEERMLALYLSSLDPPVAVSPVISPQEIADISGVVAATHVDARILRYIIELVSATRNPAAYGLPGLAPMIAFGGSPRATLSCAHASKGQAFLQGRPFVIPEDIKAVAHDVLRHRIVLTYEAAAEEVTTDRVIDQILSVVPVP